MNRFIIFVYILMSVSFNSFAMTWDEVTDMYFEEGLEYMYDTEIVAENEFIDGVFYQDYGIAGFEKKEVEAYSKFVYIEGNYWNRGGFYTGDLVIPAEVYGFSDEECWFTVRSVANMYKNGLTSLYLPETIECIAWTIESCRFLKKVQLNNSLKELEGVRDCPVLSDCPLPLSLERIGNGWMSGIAIAETDFPPSLTTIGKNVFCNNPKLERVSLGNLETMGDSCFQQLPSLQEIVIPETLQAVSAGSFSGCGLLRKVTLPQSTLLSDGCFSECPSITEVLVYAETPYAFPADCMKDTDKSKCTLYVPEGSEDLYAAADGWKEFGMIVPSLHTEIQPVSEIPQWRAFASRGKLLVDTVSDEVVTVCTLSGKTMTTIRTNGRNELALPKGVYVVTSQGKSVKVIL